MRLVTLVWNVYLRRLELTCPLGELACVSGNKNTAQLASHLASPRRWALGSGGYEGSYTPNTMGYGLQGLMVGLVETL